METGRLPVLLNKLHGTNARNAAEGTAEVRRVVITHAGSHLFDRPPFRYKKQLSLVDAAVNDVVGGRGVHLTTE